LLDGRHAFRILFLAPAVVLVKKPAQRARMHPLELLQGRPAFEQIPHQWTGHIIEPAENLREIQLQAIGQPKVRARLFIHRLAAFLHQEMQQTGFHRIRPQGAQPFAMTQQQIQQGIGVAGSLLAPEGAKVSR
jgi:hypothetical protein